MATIDDLRIMREHFHSVSRWKVIGQCLREPSSYYLADLYLLLFLGCLFAWLGIDQRLWWFAAASIGCFIGFRLRVDTVLMVIFPNFYSVFSESLRSHSYRTDFRLIRFLQFSEKLQASGLSPADAASCLNMAQKEHELTETQSATPRPLMASLTALLIALIAGASGIDSAWTKGIIPLLLYLILTLLSYTYLFSVIFRPRRFTEKEFELFIYWHANEQIA